MDKMSERSSNLDDEQLARKRGRERIAYILCIIAQLLWAINGIQMKSYRVIYPEYFTDNNVLFWRMLVVMILGYVFCKIKNIHIQGYNEIKHMKWFLIRNATAYIFILCWIKMYLFFRVSTITVIGGTTPIIVIFLSIFILGDRFYIRYIFGIALCLIGSYIIIINDRKPEAKAQILSDNIALGLFFGITNAVLVALSTLGQKVLTDDKMNYHLQNYYFGLFNCVPSFIFCLLYNEINFKSIAYILYAGSNGLIFYTANSITTLAFTYIHVSKVQHISYLYIVFTFILSAIILREPVFFTDFIGALIIIGFQYYNFIYPPGKAAPKLIEKKSNINTENEYQLA